VSDTSNKQSGLPALLYWLKLPLSSSAKKRVLSVGIEHVDDLMADLDEQEAVLGEIGKFMMATA
jgi:hypothetical protein